MKQVELQDSPLKYNKSLVKAALDGVQCRFESFLSQDDSVKEAKLATVSHPMFKLKPIHREKRDEVKNLLIAEAEKQALASEKCMDDQDNDEYFNWSDEETSDPPIGPASNSKSIEVLQFLDDPSTSLNTLQWYPVVRQIFLKFNTTIPSSAPVERLFSFGSIILQGRRGRLTDKNFEKLILMKANSTKM